MSVPAVIPTSVFRIAIFLKPSRGEPHPTVLHHKPPPCERRTGGRAPAEKPAKPDKMLLFPGVEEGRPSRAHARGAWEACRIAHGLRGFDTATPPLATAIVAAENARMKHEQR